MHAQHPHSRQYYVLRMLYLHRYLAVDQIATLVFATSSRRACQACCTTLHRKGFVHRFELARGGLGGGRASYVYALAPAGAQVLAQADNIPVVDIPVDPDAPTAQSVFVHHQLAANRCLVAVIRAARRSPRTRLLQWNSDAHSRIRYRPDGARFWRSVHPDVIALLRDADRDHWAFLEIDRGTQPLARYVAKIRRYARYQRSKAWMSYYPVFPALRVVSVSPRRAAGMAELAADVLDQFDQDVYWPLRDTLYVAATAEAELLADPFGDIWRPAAEPRDARHAWLRDGPWVPAPADPSCTDGA
ncbi:MAG: replication-relaxation family protein [Chloroflexi bacterium]|nr:replication-relaxation family protein [Chloroflexota bacterium]